MIMTCSNIVNSFGLILDIAGALLIWKFGLPEIINKSGGVTFLTKSENPENDKKEIAKGKKYDSLSGVGLTLLIIGFSLQLLSNFLN